MKPNINWLIIFCLSLTIISCGGGKKSASSVAKEWCDLNGKAHRAAAAGGSAADEARVAVKKFETEMEAKYAKDPAFMKEVGREVEKCEAASEGR